MNYPIWELITIGGPTLIAAISVFHVFISHIAVGGGLFIWLTDLKGWRENRPEIHSYLRKYTWFFLLMSLVLGAVTGVGIWFIIALVSPAATSTLIHNFVFGWAIEWVFFLGEILALLVYHYYFNRLGRKQRLTIAFLYALFAWLSLFMINGIIDFMLTPGGWLESKNFWQGFFNPTFWPSLAFRSFGAFMLAGIFGYLTTVFLEDDSFRASMLRYCTKWLLLPMILLIPSALWYYRAVPEVFRQINFLINRETSYFYILLLVCSGLIFLLGVLLSVAKNASVQKTAVFLLVPMGLLWMAGFEYTRETARKPYVIAGYMYSNSILASDQAQLNRDGILKHAKWTAVREITEDNRLEAGRELFNIQCLSCHTIGGVRNDILPLTETFPYRGMIAQLTGQGKVNTYMPPFMGTEQEKEALAAYIAGELHGKATRLPAIPPRTPEVEEVELPPFDIKNDRYLLLAWNDLGMHCISDCDSRFSFLPPANTLEAQLIKRGPVPELVTEGVEITYKVPSPYDNPSAHVDFWKFAGRIYGAEGLEQNVGLAGKGMVGFFNLDEQTGDFLAKWIPLVPYRDDGTFNPYPVIDVEARDARSSELLASTKVVAPASTEQHCHFCHGGEPRWKGVSGISDETADNILKVHDRNCGTSLYQEAQAGRPQLCQSCHADPALGAEGTPEQLNFSASMHGWHANYMSGMGDESCAMCHPIAFDGVTRCLRGIHGGGENRVLCSQCHGTLEDFSISLLKKQPDKLSAARLMANISPRLAANAEDIKPRTPWLEEPQCFACHVDFERPEPGAVGFNNYNEEPGELYRMATDNAAIRCIGCHGSTHAIYPAANPYGRHIDNIQPMQYSGAPYTIGANMSCEVCHMQEMEYPIHHENMLRMVRNEVEH
jgi:mono/diheme cytochrome c family protein